MSHRITDSWVSQTIRASFRCHICDILNQGEASACPRFSGTHACVCCVFVNQLSVYAAFSLNCCRRPSERPLRHCSKEKQPRATSKISSAADCAPIRHLDAPWTSISDGPDTDLSQTIACTRFTRVFVAHRVPTVAIDGYDSQEHSRGSIPVASSCRAPARITVWYMFLLVCVALALLINPASAALRPSDKTALQELYAATDGASWTTNTNWMVGDPCSNQWFGVTCTTSATARVL